jgi:WD40 repeat protein
MMKLLRLAILCPLLLAAGWTQTTRTWEQTKYDDFEKGTAKGVAISSDGLLTLAPAFTSLYTSPSTYIWDIAADAEGNVYAAAGSPARVYRITPEGKARIIFAPQELQVQALVVGVDGTIYAATSPDGKVYKIIHGGPAPGQAPETSHTTAEVAAAQEGTKPVLPGEKPRTSVAVDPGYTESIFFDAKTKYIWALALDHEGRLYLGTGDRGQIWRVDRNGNGAEFFKSDEAQIRVLAFDNDGNLLAGTDGSGLIYRISPQGKAFVLYSAPKKEITALAVDAEGNIYAAGAGEKRGSAPPAPSGPPSGGVIVIAPGSSPASGIQITPSGGSAGPSSPAIAAPPNIAALGGSEIYRIAPDGSPKTLWTSHEDLIYALTFDGKGQLLAGSGNRGRIFAIGKNAHTDLAEVSASQVTAFARNPKGGLYVATSNVGKIFLLGPNPVAEGTYESDVFDAKNFSKWGRVQVRGDGSFDLLARSGNVDNPDPNWSPWAHVNLRNDQPVDAPAARYLQWKAILRPGKPTPTIDSVVVNYLPKNVAPEVESVIVVPDARVPSGFRGETGSAGPGSESPIPTVKDRNSIAVKWKAHDDNDDTLVYDVYYRGDGETRWKLLREDLYERYVNLDPDLFPDGGYAIRVVASDSPSHPSGEALTGDAVSPRFEVDNTPPRIEALTAKVEGNNIHVTFRAQDSFSVIDQAEYSIDAGTWQPIEPVGQISDSKAESYDFMVPVPANVVTDTKQDVKPDDPAGLSAGEHTIIVRVYDRFDNMETGKVVVNVATGR